MPGKMRSQVPAGNITLGAFCRCDVSNACRQADRVPYAQPRLTQVEEYGATSAPVLVAHEVPLLKLGGIGLTVVEKQGQTLIRLERQAAAMAGRA